MKVINKPTKIYGNPQYITKELYPILTDLEDNYIINDYHELLPLPGTSKDVSKIEFPTTPKSSNAKMKPRKLIFSNEGDDTSVVPMEVVKLVAHVTPTKIKETPKTLIVPTAPNQVDEEEDESSDLAKFFEEEKLLLQVPDELLNKSFSPEEIKEFKRTEALLKYLKTDLIQYQSEEQSLLKEKKPLVPQLQYLQKRKIEIENLISSAQNEIVTIDAELGTVEKIIKEKELEVKSLLDNNC